MKFGQAFHSINCTVKQRHFCTASVPLDLNVLRSIITFEIRGIRLSGLATKVTQKYSTISWYINPNNSRRIIVLVS